MVAEAVTATALKKARKAVKQAKKLRITEARKIRLRLEGTCNGQPSVVGYVCSEPWAWVCIKILESGRVQVRHKLSGVERDLHKAGVYPPGGPQTAMVENQRTLRYMPPDYTGEPLDEREDRLTLARGCLLPGSVSAAAIDRIRLMRARPDKSGAFQ